MERNANESFADYKVRRAAANLAVKMINSESKGGTSNPRANRMGKGLYGKTLAAHFAKLRVTMARSLAHTMHISHAANRKAKRAAANDFRLKQAA